MGLTQMLFETFHTLHASITQREDQIDSERPFGSTSKSGKRRLFVHYKKADYGKRGL